MQMIGQFLGTSAAEGIPAPFCQCENCREAREKKGVYQRRRSSFRLSDTMILDLGADAVTQAMEYGDLTALNHVLVTHTHDDHLNPHMMMEALWSRRDRSGPLHYYFTDQAYEIVKCWMENEWILKGMVAGWVRDGIVAFHQLQYGERTVIDGIGVTPFKGNHQGNMKENSALYLLELPDGRKLFYGLDSGPYYPETLEALKNHRIDILISEATRGTLPHVPGSTHMDLLDVRELAGQLYAQGTLHDESILYLTHVNHHTGHDAMMKKVKELEFPVPTIVAYDGLCIL